MIRKANRRLVKLLMLALCMLLLAGCLQLDVRITINEDGSATITERIRFTRELLDLAGNRKPELLKLLSKEVALERMKQMGDAVALVSHDLRDVEGASKEAIIVYKVPDLNQLTYVSPWFAYPDFAGNSMVKFKMEPLYKSRSYVGGRAGEMCVTLEHVKKAVPEPRIEKDALLPPGPAPLENQVYRELAPLFRDMLKDVQVRLTFESFSPISSALPLRNRRARPTSIDLINFTDKDMDTTGGAMLDNEEVMLDLLRWRFGSRVIAAQARDSDTNHTLPAFAPLGSAHMWWLGSTTLSFKPSRQLFDRHFAGKMLDYSEWAPTTKDKHIPAKFEEIGFQK